MDNFSARRYLRESKWTARRPQASVVTTTTEPSPSYRKTNEAASSSSSESLKSLDTKPYKYLRLNRERKEIRLLTLEPGSGDEVLRCTLEHAFLDSPSLPPYETISYVCGKQNDKSVILLHGHEVQTLKTSEAALRYMRLKDRPRVLWIDSICIHQHDDQEKEHQVGMMYEIYTNTSQGLVWMGPYDRTWTKAFDSLKAILQEIVTETQDYTKFHDLLYGRGEEVPRFSQKPFSIGVHTVGFECLRLFDNPWFSRLWIVQEAALARSSVCFFGETQVTLVDILRLARWLLYKWSHLPNVSVSTYRGIVDAATIALAVGNEHGLFRAVKSAAMTNCLLQYGQHRTSDRKDCVFAILGLWQMITKATMLPDTLQPDYKLSECEIFTRATRFAIQESHSLAMVRSICEPPQEDEGAEWPSWVPVLDRDSTAIGMAASLATEYNAHNSTSAVFKFDAGKPNNLIVLGVLFDTVILVAPTFTSQMSASDTQVAIRNLERSYDDSREDKMGGLEGKLSLVLIGGTLRSDRVTGQEALSGYRDLKRYLQDHAKLPSEKGTPAHDYLNGLGIAAYNRAVFHTKDGHIGLGPKGCQPGDIVAILYGCYLPMVMRPSLEEGTFRLLGVSYVDGIMDGEAVQEHDEMEREDNIFRLV